MDRVEGVDENVGAGERQPGADAAVAKSRHDLGFGHAGEAGLGEPG
jgi:hypothetical protein